MISESPSFLKFIEVLSRFKETFFFILLVDLVEELVNLVDLVDPDKLFEATVVSESGAWCYPDLSVFLTVILKNLSSFSELNVNFLSTWCLIAELGSW